MVELTYGAQTVQLVLYAQPARARGRGYGYLLRGGLGGLLSIVSTHGSSTSSRRVAHRRRDRASCSARRSWCTRGPTSSSSPWLVTILGGIGLVACEVVAETTLARVVPRGRARPRDGVLRFADGRGDGRRSRARPRAHRRSSLSTSLLVLGAAAVIVTLACLAGLRGLDAAQPPSRGGAGVARRHHRQGPARAGRPADRARGARAAAQLCPLPPGVDVVVQGAPAHAFYVVVEGEVGRPSR